MCIRDSHLIGDLVRQATKKSVTLAELSLEEFQSSDPSLDDSVYDVLGATRPLRPSKASVRPVRHELPSRFRYGKTGLVLRLNLRTEEYWFREPVAHLGWFPIAVWVVLASKSILWSAVLK